MIDKRVSIDTDIPILRSGIRVFDDSACICWVVLAYNDVKEEIDRWRQIVEESGMSPYNYSLSDPDDLSGVVTEVKVR